MLFVILITVSSCSKNDITSTESQKVDSRTTSMIMKWVSSQFQTESSKNRADELLSLINWGEGRSNRLKNGTYLVQLPLGGGRNNISLNLFYEDSKQEIDSGYIISTNDIEYSSDKLRVIENYFNSENNYVGRLAFFSVAGKFNFEIGIRNNRVVYKQKIGHKAQVQSTKMQKVDSQQCYDMYRITYYYDGSETWEYLYRWCIGEEDCNTTTSIQLKTGNPVIVKSNCTGSGGGEMYVDPLEAAFYHKFPLNSNYQILYPKLYRLVKNLYSTALKNITTLDALKTYGHFSPDKAGDENLYKMLEFGRGAEIVVKAINEPPYNGPYRYAHYDPKNPAVIEFEVDFINQLEEGTNPYGERALEFFLFITLMHESVHYANRQNGFFEKNQEWGSGWESRVYGQNIDSPAEAWEFILKKNQ